jgi:2,4-dienoyl-CoA reductase-like NADH-dependent reductase (Old Yellow Enzyme family)
MEVPVRVGPLPIRNKTMIQPTTKYRTAVTNGGKPDPRHRRAARAAAQMAFVVRLSWG